MCKIQQSTALKLSSCVQEGSCLTIQHSQPDPAYTRGERCFVFAPASTERVAALAG